MNGRWYLVSKPLPSSGTAPAESAASASNGTLDLMPRPSTIFANWQLENTAPSRRVRNLRGLGLRVQGTGDDALLAISLRTGGPAYGVTVYQREGGRWHGRWVTSIDSARTVGEMWIEQSEGPLAGRHRFTGERSGTGRFEGVVTITAKSDELFALSYAVGGATVYRGLGVLLAYGTRLAVAWSFGSTPALAIYRHASNDSAEMTGRQFRLAREGGAITVQAEQLTRTPPGEPSPAPGSGNELFANDQGPPRVTDPLASGDAAAAASDSLTRATSAPDPNAPDVRRMSYAELMRDHRAHAEADRWLADQLDLDEQLLLEAALRRYVARKESLGDKTVAALIDEERRQDSADRNAPTPAPTSQKATRRRR